MNNTYIKNIGGLSYDAGITPSNRNGSIESRFVYFGGSLLVLDIPEKLLTIMEIYLIGYSLAVVCFDVYSA